MKTQFKLNFSTCLLEHPNFLFPSSQVQIGEISKESTPTKVFNTPCFFFELFSNLIKLCALLTVETFHIVKVNFKLRFQITGRVSDKQIIFFRKISTSTVS
ncbi:hypothetical protein HHI36_020649 [Cryptolaemus montrouzieri]|uniref:Uncharacterized protein n=1 Tax=Cryptolaemus montrouzieri TaxID=559131 RepID=A0ABD2NC12_9CUCU